MEKLFETPILFLTFNRPETAKHVFRVIKKIKPQTLFIACDGPRNIAGEKNKVHETRAIINEIDWECNLETLFRDENLGCKLAVSSAIDWFFNNNEMGIILEDDCYPDLSFFSFCEELLIKYKDKNEILHIGGTNPVDKNSFSDSYYFTKYNRIWGWASWRRAWKFFDPDIKIWKKFKKNNFHKKMFSFPESLIWKKYWDNVYYKKVDTWDYQWYFCRLINGKAIAPKTNLVKNLGFNELATHTIENNKFITELPLGKINFPLKHPVCFTEDIKRDKKWSHYIVKSFIINLFKGLLKKIK